MRTNLLKRSISLLLALILCVSALLGLGITAFAVGEQSKAYVVSFPRANDSQVDYSGSWGHEALDLMNGFSLHETKYTNFYTMNDYGGQICYCIEPGTPVNNGDVFTQKDESFWDNYPSQYNKTIDPDTIKVTVGRILQYGFTGDVKLSWVSQNPEDAKKIALATATQALIWETIVGERDEDFNHVDTGNKSPVLNMIKDNHPLRSLILSSYNDIVSSVQKHTKVPSFCAKSAAKSQEIELTWNGSEYTAILTDSNGVLSNYSFSLDNPDIAFSVSSNTLTVTAKTAPSDTVTVTADKVGGQRKGLVVWSDGKFTHGDGQQDLVSYTQSVTDPVKAFFKLKVSYGSAKIVKTSEDGKVDGISFRIQGNGIDKTVKTANGGEIQLHNLMPGVYTVTELTDNKYIPQETRRVTVVSGQTSTVNFNNKLKRGNLTVTKTSEDGLSEGIKFHLYGTSLSGLSVDEYAVTDKSGKAYFKDVLIGSGYILEEVDTPIRYVDPEKQTADIEWNTVTDKSFNNILKKWQLSVTKSDSEKGLPQGDASLAGAKYGIYKGEQLIDTYTTNENGQFTTKQYICGDDWSLREFEASEGYLLNTESLHIGAEAKLYTEEINLAPPLDSYETVKKGKIAVIKHCDDGSTQIETPEKDAEFQIYLKSAGSFANAKNSEKDTIICDEDGFASTKLLPYGVYTVHQTKGWDGREKIKDFDVFIDKDGEVYRFIINNAVFKSLIEIVKKDAETGKIIPASSIGFKVQNADTGEYIVQHINYPTPMDIDIYYTDSTGKLMLPEALPYGNYEIIEQCSAYGYVLDSKPVPFTVDGSKEVVTVEKCNTAQKGVIEITKEGEIFSSVTENNGIYTPVYETKNLANVVFQIYAAEDITTLDGTVRAYKGELVDEITTGIDGIAKSKELYLGKYTVIEKIAPNGYVNSNEQYDVKLTYAEQNISVTSTSLSVYNERQKAEISLSKVLEQNETFNIGMNNEIISVKFGLFAAEDITAADGSVIPKDCLLEEICCDENGNAIFNTDIPVGAKLYVKELSADEHYLISNQKYPVSFEYAGQDTAFVEIRVNDGEAIENKIIYGTVKGLKLDRGTKEIVEGAIFGLFKSDETEFTEETAILKSQSDKNGIFIFENIPCGDWIVKELQPAENYLQSDEIFTVTVSENKQIIEITALNDRIPEAPPVIPNIPNTGKSESKSVLIGLGTIAVGGVVSAAIILTKKKKDDGDEA